MAARLRWKSRLAIALLLMASGFGGPGSRAVVADAAPARLASSSAPAASAAPATAPPASQDPNYYAYATRYYLQHLTSQSQAESNARDPYHFFNYYQFYRERYAPGMASRDPQGVVPAWFASMPFRNARTQAFARFVQVASPSAAPAARWAQPVEEFQRTAGR